MATHAPKHLSKPSKSLWRKIVADYGLDDEAHALETLRLACEALDRGEQARAALAIHGTTYTDRAGAHRARPEVAIERDSRIAVMRAFRELSLDGDVPNARVPRVGGGRS
jgi:phage terminase small subunit